MDSDINNLQKIQLIQPYLNTRNKQITEYNQKNKVNKDLAINGRNLTNFGIFRKYISEYLENHSAINKNMTLMVRQLAPTPQCLLLEIYALSTDKTWVIYEYVMYDIFDHLFAARPSFYLEVSELPHSLHSYQHPSD